MNTNIVFSRYLYNVDEVLLTFVERLLKQSSLEECYFWIYEYYKSGFEKETWNFIWKVYYDFYAYNFPKMERKIIQFYKKWKTTHDFINIMHIVKNLHRFTPKATSKIMLLRTYYSTRLVRIFKQNPKFKLEVECTNKYEELLVRSIFEKCWESTAYYLKKIIKSSNSSKLLENILKKKIKTNHFYEDEFHQLIIKIINNKDESKWYIHKTSIEEMNKVLDSLSNYKYWYSVFFKQDELKFTLFNQDYTFTGIINESGQHLLNSFKFRRKKNANFAPIRVYPGNSFVRYPARVNNANADTNPATA